MNEKSVRHLVHKALKEERQAAELQSDAHQARRLGLFMQASLKNLGISPEEMARRLALDPDLAKGILDGMLPIAEIDDDLLREMASLLQYPVSTLAFFLGREIPEANETGQEARKKS